MRYETSRAALACRVDLVGSNKIKGFDLLSRENSQSVFSTRLEGEVLVLSIGPRYGKLLGSALLLLVLSGAMVWFWTHQDPKGPSSFGMMAINLGLFLLFSSSLYQGWLATKSVTLEIGPDHWQMERNGKKICQGTRRPELLFEFGLTKGFVLKLSDAETLSASFGQSLKAHELESVAALIRSFVEKNFASQSTQADSFGELAVQMGEVKFRSTRFSLLRSLSSLFQTFQVVKSPTKLMTDVTPLQTFEFTSVGFMRDAVLWVFGSSKEVFLSHDGTIAVEVSPGGPGAPETRYSFSTLMDDGRYRLTGTSVATEGLVYSMPSSMNFERDLQSHRAWISEQIEVHNTRPVAMNSMGDRKRVWRYYVRNLEARVTSLTVLGLVGLVFVLLGLVVSFIMESLH